MDIEEIAKQMVVKGKGILAADESTPTCSKRFDSISIDSTYENRNEYRNMLFTADNLEEYISGVILFDETFRQSTTCNDKIPFVEYLTSKGIIPGIKVDKGAKDLAGFKNEKITEQLNKNTLQAKENNVFGVPTFIYGNELFFGQDRLFMLEQLIKE